MAPRVLAVCLAGLSAMVAGGVPLQAFPAVADYCNTYAADRAAGRPGAAYDVAAERRFLDAYRFCMEAHDTPLDILFMKFGDEALAEAAEEAAENAAGEAVEDVQIEIAPDRYAGSR